jgi:hypothetical protein
MRYDVFSQRTGKTLFTVRTAFLAWVVVRFRGEWDYAPSGQGWV